MSEHKWTTFELQTMLALIAKGVHITGRVHEEDEFGNMIPKLRNADPFERHRQARLDFVSAVNEALHGDKRHFNRDIKKSEILDKLNQLLVKKKHVLGPNGLVERSKVGRITRNMTLAMKRTHGMDFDGSEAEWQNGRKMEVTNKLRESQGLAKLPSSAFEVSAKPPTPQPTPKPTIRQRVYRKYKEVDPGAAEFARIPIRTAKYGPPNLDFGDESPDEGEIFE